MNKQHSNIKFTNEIESNSKLSFLDVSVDRVNNSFETSISRKNTFTGLGMRYDSFVPHNYKINIISCLVNRAFKICSRLCSFEEEIKFLKEYFCQNKFPLNIVNNVINSTLKKLYNSNNPVPTVQLKSIYFCLPFIGFHSQALKRNLKKILSEFFPQINLRFINLTQNRISDYFKFKDILPLSLSSSVIYQYTCGQCSESYIGETRKALKVRISQHKGRSFRTNNLLNVPNSTIFDHYINYNHIISDDNFKILDRCREFDLKILESIYISEIKPSLNSNSGCFELQIVK